MLIRETLCDIAKTAYPDYPWPKKLTAFRVNLNREEQRRSKHACCRLPYGERRHSIIEVYNFYRGDKALIQTCIHELAHHVDWCFRGTSDHSKEFYEAYEKLLFAALDMGLLDAETFEASEDSSGSAKVAKMLTRYVPNPIEYKTDTVTIQVQNGFTVKDMLKSFGFSYNSGNTCWEKEIQQQKKDEETASLVALGIEYTIVSATSMSFKEKGKVLVAGQGSFAIKDELKADGFFFAAGEKVWKKRIPLGENHARFKRYYEYQYPDVKWRLSDK